MFEQIPIDTLAPSALLGIVVLLILTGRLVPRRNLEDVEKAAQEANKEVRLNAERVIEDARHDRDEWRAAHRISETARVELAEQLDSIIEIFRPSLRSMSRADPEDVRPS